MPYYVPLVFAGEAGTINADTLSSITTAIKAQFTEANVVGVLSAGITAAIGLVFVWWGARKLASMVNKAMTRGKLRL